MLVDKRRMEQFQIIQPRSALCGQSADYTDAIYSGNLNLIAIVFQPIAARAIFGIPMNDIRDKNIDIDFLGDISLLYLDKQLQETKDNYQCVFLIEQYLFMFDGHVNHSPEEVRQMIEDMIAYGKKYDIVTPCLRKLLDLCIS